MKTREDILHSCSDCNFSFLVMVGGEGLVKCFVYPTHTMVKESHFCGQWTHGNNYDRQYNQSKNQLTVTE